ncbi:uncharacterized protein PHA67_010192 [Liasis olivaceus]
MLWIYPSQIEGGGEYDIKHHPLSCMISLEICLFPMSGKSNIGKAKNRLMGQWSLPDESIYPSVEQMTPPIFLLHQHQEYYCLHGGKKKKHVLFLDCIISSNGQDQDQTAPRILLSVLGIPL